MNDRARAAWSAITLGYVAAITAAVIGRDIKRERDRVRGIVDDTTVYLNERAGEIETRMIRARAKEQDAHYSPDWDAAPTPKG